MADGWRAALVVDNLALAGRVAASSQEQAMPASNLLTPHTTERWRSMVNSAFFVVDMGGQVIADTAMLKGLTAGIAASARCRLSSIDSTGAAGDGFDSGVAVNGSANLDVDYGAAVWVLTAPVTFRYARFDIEDADASYVEAGSIIVGLREAFAYNFAPGGSIQYVDRSRVATTAAGLSLVEEDNWFRRIDLSFDINEVQRYGVVERLDRVAGRRKSVLLLINPESSNLPRDAIFGLVTDLTPSTWAQAVEVYGKQLRIEERL